MKVVGIITEYNPFHNGHKYQIENLKKRTGADYCIVVMSGNFLQRGVPALCSKYDRARMALSCGVDLVLELPTLWATSSAELFAKGGVSVLANTGVVTHLGFGAETDDLELLRTVSSILKEEPSEYTTALRDALRQGEAFPVARAKALCSVLNGYSDIYLEEVLSSPNNILALEYLKALPEHITPVLVQRKGAGYHDTSMDTELPSASAIREALFSTKPDTSAGNVSVDMLATAMPEKAYEVLQGCIAQNALINTADLSEILGYRLLSLSREELPVFADCSEELANTISNRLSNYQGFDTFCQELKSKNYTYTRISRTLLHILLNIKEKDIEIGRQAGYAPYLRVLGFRKESSELLSAIKKEAQTPLITKVADYTSYFDNHTNPLMELDLYASALYQQILTTRKGVAPSNDYVHPIVIL